MKNYCEEIAAKENNWAEVEKHLAPSYEERSRRFQEWEKRQNKKT